MRRGLAICRKELQLYFYSPVAYVAFAFYFLIAGYFFSLDFLGTNLIDIRRLLGSIMVVYLFVIPLLTMRLVSDELRQGTDELLFTSPASLTEIVLGKYLAALAVQAMLVVGSFIYPIILASFGDLDLPVMWMSYLSMFLLGASMMAVGLFASTLSSHQMVSGIAAFGLLLLLWMIDWLGEAKYGEAKEWILQFSMIGRTQEFNKGVFDLADFTFFITLIAMFLFLSIQVMERKRWK